MTIFTGGMTGVLSPGNAVPSVCALEDYAIGLAGEGQTTTLSGDNNRVITATSLGTTNTISAIAALNTVFQANQNQIIWLGEALVTAQSIPADTAGSAISFDILFSDLTAETGIAGVSAVWRNGADVNKLRDFVADTNIADIDLSNGFKLGMYYNVQTGVITAALDSVTTFALTNSGAIDLANTKGVPLRVSAGNIEDTSISVSLTQSGVDTIQAFPSAVPWCDAEYIA